jgi:uncharacterized protein HemX
MTSTFKSHKLPNNRPGCRVERDCAWGTIMRALLCVIAIGIFGASAAVQAQPQTDRRQPQLRIQELKLQQSQQQLMQQQQLQTNPAPLQQQQFQLQQSMQQLTQEQQLESLRLQQQQQQLQRSGVHPYR